MKIVIELNERYNQGYQVHIVSSQNDGDLYDRDEIYNESPITYLEARQLAAETLDQYNDDNLTSYNLADVIQIEPEAVRVNSRTDIVSARIFSKMKEDRKAKSNEKILKEAEDDFWAEVDEFIEYLVGEFVIWDESYGDLEEGELRRLCEYVSSYEGGDGASALFHRLTGMPIDEAADWIDTNVRKIIKKTHDLNGIRGYIMNL